MRELSGAESGLRDRSSFEGGDGASACGFRVDVRLVGADGFFDLRTDAHHGIKGSHGLLENHGDFTSADSAPFAFTQGSEIPSRGSRGRSKARRYTSLIGCGQPNF